MPRRDRYHDAVKSALIKDGWVITHDPLPLAMGEHKVFVDLGAERLLGAERGNEKIAVEIKMFVGPSQVTDLEHAVGQYLVYRTLLRRHEPGRRLVLAVSEQAYNAVVSADLGRAVREDYALSIVVFDVLEEEIRQWLL